MRPYVTAAVALVGAGAIAVTPVTAPPKVDHSLGTASSGNVKTTRSLAAQYDTWGHIFRVLSGRAPAEESVYNALVDLVAAVDTAAPSDIAKPQRAAVNQTFSAIGHQGNPAINATDGRIQAVQLTADSRNQVVQLSPDGRSAAVQTADGNILNIPINLIQDIINVPYNFIQGVNLLGEALLFSGSWWLASSTNVWGTDPGDPGHWYGLYNLFPFPAFSNALAAQVVGLSAVLFPINSNCNDVDCPNAGALNGGYLQPARLLELLTTGQYTFDNTPVTYPDGEQRPPEGLWSFGGRVDWGGSEFNHPEWDTVTDPVTGRPVMPWAGTTFKLDLLSPLRNYWVTHLMSDPTSPENRIKIPTITQVARAVTNLVSGLFVAYSPFFPGSWYCLSLCDPMPPKPPFFWDTYPFPTDWPTLIGRVLTGVGDFLADPFGWLTPRPWTPPVAGDSITTPGQVTPAETGSLSAQSGDIPKSGAIQSLNQETESGQQSVGVQQNDSSENVVIDVSAAAPTEESPAPQQAPVADQSPAPQQALEADQPPAPQQAPEEEESPAPQEAPEEEESPAPQEAPETAPADQGSGTVVTGSKTTTKNTTTPTNETDDGKKGSMPASGVNKTTPRGGLAGALRSVRDQLKPNSSKTSDESNGTAKSDNAEGASEK